MDTKERTGRRRSAPGEKTTRRSAPPRGTAATKAKTPVRATRRKTAAPKPGPDVVYTQPAPFDHNGFLLKIITVVAVVVALLFGMAIFFRVKTVTVAGSEKYTAWEIREASGIRDGENLLTLSEAQISSRIIKQLPYVNKVRIGIKLPDTVKIEIEELDVVYAVEASDASWWLIRADGTVVDATNAADAERHTRILGVQLDAPEIGRTGVAAEPIPETSAEGEETVPVTVRSADRLDAAISIIQYLESNRIIGEAATVHVEDMGQLSFWYQDRFQVILGDTTQLSYKIQLAAAAINSYVQTYDSGVLDASLTVKADPEKEHQVILTPFP